MFPGDHYSLNGNCFFPELVRPADLQGRIHRKFSQEFDVPMCSTAP